ncbi:hypothetical protein A3L04_06520 [Thermococcus chitonophagus]|uniref:Uncharacterized protein n=1 Tax=Thermococcus chitonophagus TaxID=54262 RepID=A0A160VTH0_9EURY|nr:hypothetical protein [Thermococcus chitonophagus]ASJ16750.1 hypothetical protein A3L04_06520 [Thermococcus chitonophagus]CUX78220.1 hypothetical protein CHITON_1441 [Thermococcus chitonophagus]
MIERIKLREELSEEDLNKVVRVIEKLKRKFPGALTRKTKTGEKVSFIDVSICDGINFDVVYGRRNGVPFIVVEMEGRKAVMAFGIMKFILEEAGLSYAPECDGSEAYNELKKKMKAKTLLDFLG